MEQIAPQISQQTAVRAASTRSLLYAYVKRLIDIGLSAVGLVVLSPVFLVIGLAIALDSGLPILYRCQRIG